MLQVRGIKEEVKITKTLSNIDNPLVTPGPKYEDQAEDYDTKKWNPLTFSIYNANLELIQYFIQFAISNTKKLIKVPGLFDTQELNKLFPFIVALQNQNNLMFQYFWSDLGYLWNEDTFENLFKLLAKKDQSDYIDLLF